MITKTLATLTKRIVISTNRLSIQPFTYSFGTYNSKGDGKDAFLYGYIDSVSTKVEKENTQSQSYILFAKHPGDTGGAHQNNKQGKNTHKYSSQNTNKDKQFPGSAQNNNPDEGSGDVMRDSKAAKEHLQDEKYDRGGVSEQSPNIDDKQKRKKADPIKPDTKEHKQNK